VLDSGPRRQSGSVLNCLFGLAPYLGFLAYWPPRQLIAPSVGWPGYLIKPVNPVVDNINGSFTKFKASHRTSKEIAILDATVSVQTFAVVEDGFHVLNGKYLHMPTRKHRKRVHQLLLSLGK
jgi:hypothetical protein